MFTQLETGLGLNIVLWLQSMQAAPLDTLALILDFLGNDIAFALLVMLFYWSVDRSLGRRALVVLILGEVVATALKLIFQSPRPFMVAPEQVRLIVDPGSFGIPSGHVTISLALLGYAVLWAKWRQGWLWVGLYTVVMAWSRMYAGAHYPQDVIIGAVVGLGLAWFSYRFMDTFARYWRSLGWQIKLALIVVAALVIAFGFFDVSEDQQMALGIVLGGGLALLAEERWLVFDAGNVSWLRRLARFVIGVGLLGIVYYGMKALFDEVQPEMIFRTVRYGLVGAVALAGLPWLSMRLGLMNKTTQPHTTQAQPPIAEAV